MTHSGISEYIYGIHIFGYFQKIQTLILWYFLFPCILTGLCSEAVRMLVILSGSAALVITLSLIFSLLYILLPGHIGLFSCYCWFVVFSSGWSPHISVCPYLCPASKKDSQELRSVVTDFLLPFHVYHNCFSLKWNHVKNPVAYWWMEASWRTFRDWKETYYALFVYLFLSCSVIQHAVQVKGDRS